MKDNKNNKDESEKNTETKREKTSSIVNSHIDKFNLQEHSLDHETTPEDIGYTVKR